MTQLDAIEKRAKQTLEDDRTRATFDFRGRMRELAKDNLTVIQMIRQLLKLVDEEVERRR